MTTTTLNSTVRKPRAGPPAARKVRVTADQAITEAAEIPAFGLTTAELARLLRVGTDRVRGWIRSGELIAIDTADHRRLARPRFVVLPKDLEAFLKRRAASVPPKLPPRRRRRADVVDFYPD
jgi:excisionase family DNA binding protein